MSIKKIIMVAVKKCFSIDLDEGKIVVDISDDNKYYYTDVALVLSKLLDKNPIDTANVITNNIERDAFDKLEVDNFGIINVFLNKKYLINVANNIIESGKKFGKSNYGKGKKVNIGYSLITNIADNDLNFMRMAIYGDCLSNIMAFVGYDVTREVYMKNTDSRNFEKLIKQLDSIRINFDSFTEEKNLYDNGVIDLTLNKLQKSNKCYIEEDSLWLETRDLYDDKNRILVDGNGTYSSLLLQISYHVYKYDKGYDKIIDMMGINDYVSTNSLKFGIECAGYSPDKIKFIDFASIVIHDSVNINLDDLINKFDVNNLRYHLVSINNNLIEFDLIRKNSDENPIYYIEKSYIKLYSILKKYSHETIVKYGTIDSDSAYIILNKLIKFEDTVIEASNGNVNILRDYLYELACLFNGYYNELENADKHYEEDLIILSALRVVMNNTSNILGLILREEL